MFDTVLIANRGEIALRVMRACKELGLRTVAVYSEADRDAWHVQYADAAYLIGPASAAQSYLNIPKIIEVAKEAGAGAIHPGYGFLAENANFAQACEDAGIVFVGPPVSAMERMGGKVAARREAIAAGVPVVPGTTEPVESPDAILELGKEFGFPLAIKAVGGGGGRGFRVVQSAAEVPAAFESARREAESGFGNPQVYIEKYMSDPRHIEIQVLADTHGTVLHLGERECSVQRRHQKLIEECPSPVLTPEMRQAMGRDAVSLTRSVGYVSAGTLEFIFQDGQYYFLEMNTRIQVEHTVTEMVTGIDLVQSQLRIAQGQPLGLTQADITWRGHAIECRINAEDASANFRPAFGTLHNYVEPDGFGIRIDSGVRKGDSISPHYDSMIAKLVVWAANRDSAIARMRRALADFDLGGITSTQPFHQLALAHPAFAEGHTTVNFIPRYLNDQLAALAPASIPMPDEQPEKTSQSLLVEVNGRRFDVRVFGVAAAAPNGQSQTVQRRDVKRKTAAHAPVDGVMSALQGTVTAVKVEANQEVKAGQILFLVEAMKMENEITASHDGIIEVVHVSVGQAIDAGSVLAKYAAKAPA